MSRISFFLFILLSTTFSVFSQEKTNDLSEKYLQQIDSLFQSAQVDLESILALADLASKELGGDHAELAKVYDKAGFSYLNFGKFEKANQYFTKAYEIRQRILDEGHPDFAESYYHLGIISKTYDDYDQAFQYFFKALDIVKPLDSSFDAQKANYYHGLAVLYLGKGNYEKATDFLKKALDIKIIVFGEEHIKVASTYNVLGIACKDKSDYEFALGYYEKALNINLKLNGENHAFSGLIYNNMGAVYELKKQPRKALDYYLKALAIRLKTIGEAHPHTGITYNNLGITYKNIGMLDSSLVFFEKGLRTSKNIFGDDHPDVAMAYTNIGNLFLEKKDFDEALKYQNNAFSIWEKASGEGLPEIAQQNIGDIFAAQGSDLKALEHYQKSLSFLVEDFFSTDYFKNPSIDAPIKSNIALLTSLHSKAKILNTLASAEGNSEEHLAAAVNTYDLAVNLIDQIRTAYNRKESKQFILGEAIPIIEENIRVSQKTASESGRDSFLNKAFSLIEKSKSLLLLESFQESKARKFANIPEDMIQREDSLKLEIAFFEEKIQQEKQRKDSGDAAELIDFQNTVFALKIAHDSLLKFIEHSFPAYYKLKYDLSTISIEEVQRKILSPDQALIEYFVGNNSLYIFLITPERYDLLEVPLDFPLQEWVEQLQKGIIAFHTEQKHSEQEYATYTALLVESAHQLYLKYFKLL